MRFSDLEMIMSVYVCTYHSGEKGAMRSVAMKGKVFSFHCFHQSNKVNSNEKSIIITTQYDQVVGAVINMKTGSH